MLRTDDTSGYKSDYKKLTAALIDSPSLETIDYTTIERLFKSLIERTTVHNQYTKSIDEERRLMIMQNLCTLIDRYVDFSQHKKSNFIKPYSTILPYKRMFLSCLFKKGAEKASADSLTLDEGSATVSRVFEEYMEMFNRYANHLDIQLPACAPDNNEKVNWLGLVNKFCEYGIMEKAICKKKSQSNQDNYELKLIRHYNDFLKLLCDISAFQEQCNLYSESLENLSAVLVMARIYHGHQEMFNTIGRGTIANLKTKFDRIKSLSESSSGIVSSTEGLPSTETHIVNPIGTFKDCKFVTGASKVFIAGLTSDTDADDDLPPSDAQSAYSSAQSAYPLAQSPHSPASDQYDYDEDPYTALDGSNMKHNPIYLAYDGHSQTIRRSPDHNDSDEYESISEDHSLSLNRNFT